MRVTTDGIVLKQNRISNNRRIIVLFTKEYGKISAGTSINERSRKRSALALRPFTYVEYELFKNRNVYTIDNASVRKSFYEIGEDLDRFEISSMVLAYLDKVLEEGVPRPRMFELTLEFFETVSQAKSNFRTIMYAYMVKNFAMQGILPEIRQCTDCGKKYEVMGGAPAFSVSGGGILCNDCLSKYQDRHNTLIFEPDFDIVEVIGFFIKKPLSTFIKMSLKPDVERQIDAILGQYVDYHLGTNILLNNYRL